MQASESPFSPPRLCLRILLAEDIPVIDGQLSDHEVPQTLIVRMLDKLGHMVVPAATGRQALILMLDERFDLVLMDVHMSGMDSANAAMAIREQEKVLGGHVPIIAMSDHTMRVDRKRCLAAGMDAYTSKPRNAKELQTILLTLSDPESIRRTRRPTHWNRTTALERAGGDENALNNLVDVFVNEKPILLAEMNHALHTQQPDLLERTALKLGEELSYLGAPELSRVARELALLGMKRDFVRAGALALALQSQLLEMDAVMTGATL
jgi:two-component system sensor histidine kinase/response regulator